MTHYALAVALAALCSIAPAYAFDNTASVSGNPLVYADPNGEGPAVGRLPAGATVTLEACTPDNGNGFPGYPRWSHSDGDWCKVRGVGWVDASFLIGMRAKVNVTPPTSLVDTPDGLFKSEALDRLDDMFDTVQ